AGADAVQRAVNGELEQGARMRRGTARGSGLYTLQAQGIEVQTVAKGLKEAHRILLGHVYVAAAMACGSLPAFGCPRYPLGKPLGTHHAPGQDFTLTTHLTLDKPYAIGAYFVQC